MHSQEALDADGRWQSHQWAELPAPVAAPFIDGGLKHVRRMTERYCSYGFLTGARRVRGTWRAGEPHLCLRFYHVPGVHGRELVHLGRLRLGGTLDVYRGYHAVRGGKMVAAEGQPNWPADIPWVAPSAGEFIETERGASCYRGLFEIRVQRRASGCELHTLLVDVPPAATGLAARLWKQPWAPLGSAANVAFLQHEIAAAARAQGAAVHFQPRPHSGVPERPRFHFDPAPSRVV